MIRLGSLAGYPFEGPRVLGGWTPPPVAAVFAILYRADPHGAPRAYAVIDVDHADDLRDAGLPFGHERAKCWEQRAGNKWNLHICTYEVPGGRRSHREQIVQELVAVYRPGCSPEQFDQHWEEEWIGSYRATTAGPLTTARDLDGSAPGQRPG
ncbi:hypothetical protein [Candidatus Poriferisodalis sp.]|uniref:hypothetical protein n=1 Tax=Candidatus Poriferisodalis sp. TaxID=3101277 RepID=UPI003B027880